MLASLSEFSLKYVFTIKSRFSNLAYRFNIFKVVKEKVNVPIPKLSSLLG